MKSKFTTNKTHKAATACQVMHDIADGGKSTVAKVLGAEPLYTDGTGPVRYPAFQPTVEMALMVALLKHQPSDFEDEDEELLCEQSIAVNVMRCDGELSYEVAFASSGSDYGITCTVTDLADLHDWFDEEWILDFSDEEAA